MKKASKPGIVQQSEPAAGRVMRKPLARLLTVQEFAQLSGWKVATVRQKLWLRKLPYVKLQNRSVRISEDVLRELIERGSVPTLEC